MKSAKSKEFIRVGVIANRVTLQYVSSRYNNLDKYTLSEYIINITLYCITNGYAQLKIFYYNDIVFADIHATPRKSK